MVYTPTGWINNAAPNVNAANLNKIETGITDAHSLAGTAQARADDAYTVASAAGGGSYGRPEIVVAASNSPLSVRNSAAYVCDGTDDQVEINAALAKAAVLQSLGSASPAGAIQATKVILVGGRFNISAPILMHTATSLVGMGWGTEVRCVGNTGVGAIALAHPSVHLAEVAHLFLNGNYSAGGTCSGIYFDMTGSTNAGVSNYPSSSPDAYHLVHDLFIDGFSSGVRHGIYMGATTTANNRGNIVDRCQVRNISGHGIYFSAASDSFVSNCHVGSIGMSGYRIATGNMKIANCKSFYCNEYGFYASSGRGTMVGFESQDDATGIFLDAEPWSVAGITADTFLNAGLRIGAAGCVVSGLSIFMRGGARYATGAAGLLIDAAHTDLSLIGVVDPLNITTPVSGAAGARSFVRVSNGTTLVSVG